MRTRGWGVVGIGSVLSLGPILSLLKGLLLLGGWGIASLAWLLRSRLGGVEGWEHYCVVGYVEVGL
jgi:hypothetical protein